MIERRGMFRSAYAALLVPAFAVVFLAGTARATDFGPDVAHVSSLLRTADVARGQRLAVQCKACHVLEKDGGHKVGPNLWNVVGRRQAAAPGFRYSKALQALDGFWSFEALNAFLANPRRFAPGNRMAFAGLPHVRDRADLIAYLRTLSDAPRPLPASLPARTIPKETDDSEDYGGLPPGPGRDLVYGLCSACHSIRLVTQQGLDRDDWDETLDWMTEEQEMPDIRGPERELILDYLSTYYGRDRKAAKRFGRR